MQSLLVFFWVLFILMLIVDVIGCVNLIRVLKMRSKERLQNLLFGLTVAVLFTVYISLLLFSPDHHNRAAFYVITAASGLNVIFYARQAFKTAKEGDKER